MSQTIELTSADGFKFPAYVAQPAGTPKGGVVVLQEIFGVNSHIRSVADGYAKDGWLAVAPALYDRVQRKYESGYSQDEIQAGIAVRGKITNEQALADTQAAIDYAQQAGKVGIVGYCWGGTLAYLAAGKLTGLAAAVGYYGGQIASSFLEVAPKVPTMLHFGETDHGIPLADVQKIIDRYPDMPIHIYGAGHGFNCDQRGSYDKPSAELALTRTLEFFHQNLA